MNCLDAGPCYSDKHVCVCEWVDVPSPVPAQFQFPCLGRSLRIQQLWRELVTGQPSTLLKRVAAEAGNRQRERTLY